MAAFHEGLDLVSQLILTIWLHCVLSRNFNNSNFNFEY